MSNIVYLATPYTHHDKTIMDDRYKAACHMAGKLMNDGLIILSPACHSHPIAIHNHLPRDWAYWEKIDREFLRVSSRMIVVKLPGWRESKGIAAEVAMAKELGIPVEYIKYDL